MKDVIRGMSGTNPIRIKMFRDKRSAAEKKNPCLFIIKNSNS